MKRFIDTRTTAFGYLLGLQFFYAWAWSSSDVLRPLFRSLYGLSLGEAGAAYSSQVAGAFVGAVFVGQVRHRLGRRPTLALIGCGCGLTLAAGALVTDIVGLIAQRIALGLFMGAVFPVTVGVLVDLFPTGQRGRLASVIDATYFSAVIVLGWAAALWIEIDWRLLFWPAGLAMVLIGIGALRLPIDDHAEDRPQRAPLARDLFARELRRKTLALTALVSANACGHQAFVGWLTTYLVEVERVSGEGVAATLTAQYTGSIVGCFAWGLVVDKTGRRTGALGLLAAGAFAALFVLAPGPLFIKQAAVFGFGFGFGAVATIGPWLAELYPPALREPATSIFQWGRAVSLAAPPATGLLAEAIGLTAVMGLAAAAFLASGLIWRALPETHQRAWRRTVPHPNRSGR
jgi:MFS family permease